MKNNNENGNPSEGTPEKNPGELAKEELRLREELERKQQEIQDDKERLKADESGEKAIESELKAVEKEEQSSREHEHGRKDGDETSHKGRDRFFFIGKERYETEKPSLTVREILVDFAKVDPAKKTLALKKDGGFDEYTDLTQNIPIVDGMHFILFDVKPTPVS